MRKHSHISLLATLLLLGACSLDVQNIGTPVTATASEAMTTTGTTTDLTTAPTDPTEGAAESSSSTGESPGSGSSAGESSGSDTDTDGGLPAECSMADPEVDGSFSLDLSGWSDPPQFEIDYDVLCTVDAVSTAGGKVTTALACEVEGEPKSALLVIAAAPEGDVMWKAGDDVHLVSIDISNGEVGVIRSVQLRGGVDDALLLSANSSGFDELIAERFKPLVLETAFACGPPNGDIGLRVDFTPEGGPTLGIFSAQRDLLPISAQEGFAIDVESAIGNEIHAAHYMRILLRRVHTAG